MDVLSLEEERWPLEISSLIFGTSFGTLPSLLLFDLLTHSSGVRSSSPQTLLEPRIILHIIDHYLFQKKSLLQCESIIITAFQTGLTNDYFASLPQSFQPISQSYFKYKYVGFITNNS